MLLLASSVHAGLGLVVNLVSDEAQTTNAFPVVASGNTTELWHDAEDYKGVIRAIGDLQLDVERVTNRKPQVATRKTSCGQPIIIGTLGHSS